MVIAPANDCIVIITPICSKNGDQKLFRESRTDITTHSLGETELCEVKICPADTKVRPSELATEFDFKFFSHHLTPVKLWDKAQRGVAQLGNNQLKKICSDLLFLLEWTSQRPFLTEEQFVDIFLKRNTHRHSLILAFLFYQKGRKEDNPSLLSVCWHLPICH